jgi:hypothetical protein
MTDETQDPQPNTPGYKSRRMLQAENDELKTGLAALMERVNALESKPSGGTVTVDGLVAALKQDRESALSARLQQELDAARAQIEDLQRPATPTSPGIPYTGWVQATEDCWFPVGGYRKGPSAEGPGEFFEISMPDYWPGCPFKPMKLEKVNADGSRVFVPHPDFASH